VQNLAARFDVSVILSPVAHPELNPIVGHRQGRPAKGKRDVDDAAPAGALEYRVRQELGRGLGAV